MYFICELSFTSSFAKGSLLLVDPFQKYFEIVPTTGIFSENISRQSLAKTIPHSSSQNEQIDHSNGVLMLS